VCHVYRLVFAPPGTPSEKVAILSKALRKTLEDERLIKWSKETKRTMGPAMTASEVQEMIKKFIPYFEKYSRLWK
jgi:tripartite-type tricarboxylate transporter receptor subunit TctC